MKNGILTKVKAQTKEYFVEGNVKLNRKAYKITMDMIQDAMPLSGEESIFYMAGYCGRRSVINRELRKICKEN